MQDRELRKEDAYPTVSPQRNKPPPAHRAGRQLHCGHRVWRAIRVCVGLRRARGVPVERRLHVERDPGLRVSGGGGIVSVPCDLILCAGTSSTS
jgi:hypothetical protein